MAQNTRYGKPSLTDLPPELGRQIINEIMHAPRPDTLTIQKKNLEVMEELRRKLEIIK